MQNGLQVHEAWFHDGKPRPLAAVAVFIDEAKLRNNKVTDIKLTKRAK